MSDRYCSTDVWSAAEIRSLATPCHINIDLHLWPSGKARLSRRQMHCQQTPPRTHYLILSPHHQGPSPDRALGQRPRPKGPYPQVRYTCRANSSTSDNAVRGGRVPDHVLSARPNIGNGLIARCVRADAKLLEGASIATWRDRSCSSTHVGYLHHFSPRRTSTAHVRSIGISCMTSSAYIASGVRLFGNGLSRALRNIPERSSKLAQWPSGVDLAIWNSRGSIDWRDKVT